MTVFTIAASEDITAWIHQKSVAFRLSAEQTISAILKEGMERSADLSGLEGDLLKALRHYGAGPRVGVAADTLWFHWMMKVSGTSGKEIGRAIEGLVKRGFVVAPEGEGSIYLTDAGLGRLKSLAP